MGCGESSRSSKKSINLNLATTALARERVISNLSRHRKAVCVCARSAKCGERPGGASVAGDRQREDIALDVSEDEPPGIRAQSGESVFRSDKGIARGRRTRRRWATPRIRDAWREEGRERACFLASDSITISKTPFEQSNHYRIQSLCALNAI